MGFIPHLSEHLAMNLRHLLTAVGAGITTFLVVAVLVIELLAIEFSAIVGIPLGLLAGLVVTIGLAVSFDNLNVNTHRAVSVYGTFGLAMLVMLAARYANLGLSRDVLSIPVMVSVGIVAGATVYTVLVIRD